MKNNINIWSYPAQLFLELKKMFETKFVVKIKTHLILSNFSDKNRAVCEIM